MMYELDPNPQQQAIDAFYAAVNALPEQGVRTSWGYEQRDACTISSGNKHVFFELRPNQDMWGVTARTWNESTYEITELSIFPGDVTEPTTTTEVFANAERKGYSGYIRPPEDNSTKPHNVRRDLSARDVVAATMRVPRDQFEQAAANGLRTMLSNPDSVRSLAPEQVTYFDPKLDAELQAPIVEGSVASLSLVSRARGVWTSLVTRFFGAG